MILGGFLGLVDSFQTGSQVVVLPGSWGRLLLCRNPTTSDMSNALSALTSSEAIDFLAKKLDELNDQKNQTEELLKKYSKSLKVVTEVITSVKKEVDIQKNYDEDYWSFMTIELRKLFDRDSIDNVYTYTDFVIGKLKECRRYVDYRMFVGVYHEANNKGDYELRQLLKTISAVDRYRFLKSGQWEKNYNTAYTWQHVNNTIPKLLSEIKFASICPHCGATAKLFVDRLKKDGFM